MLLNVHLSHAKPSYTEISYGKFNKRTRTLFYNLLSFHTSGLEERPPYGCYSVMYCPKFSPYLLSA